MAEIGKDILKAKAILESGGLVAIPTETVYGLAANALDREAVLNIFKVKERPAFDPLIVHVHNLERISEVITEIPNEAKILFEQFSPGPITLLLPKKAIIPDITSSGLKNVGIRIPNHKMTLELLKNLSFPLAAPSANPFGYVSPTSAKHVNDQLGNKIDYILDGGDCSIGIESTIIGFEEKIPHLYRYGGLGIDDIESLIGKIKININQSSNPKSSGQLKSHYATKKPLELFVKIDPDQVDADFYYITYNQKLNKIQDSNQFELSSTGNLEEAAFNLFNALRVADASVLKKIICCLVPDHGIGKAINDRLWRASYK